MNKPLYKTALLFALTLNLQLFPKPVLAAVPATDRSTAFQQMNQVANECRASELSVADCVELMKQVAPAQAGTYVDAVKPMISAEALQALSAEEFSSQASYAELERKFQFKYGGQANAGFEIVIVYFLFVLAIITVAGGGDRDHNHR